MFEGQIALSNLRLNIERLYVSFIYQKTAFDIPWKFGEWTRGPIKTLGSVMRFFFGCRLSGFVDRRDLLNSKEFLY